MTLARTAALALILAALTTGSIGAPAPPPPAAPVDAEAPVLQELVVRGRLPGPAWWRVSSGTSSVWVLGVPGALPKGLAWDRSVLQRRLAKAGRVILPATASIGPLDVFGVFGVASKLRAPAPFEPTLPPDLAARYVADTALVRQKPDHYDRWKPAVAGLVMLNDFRNQAGLDNNQPLNAIKGDAARAGVRAQPAAVYPAMPAMKMLASELSPAVNLACLADSLHEIEAGSARVKAAAQAWAVGDVAGALTAERGFERCVAALPNGADLARRANVDQTAAIARSLKAPGEAIAVVELRSLVSQGGVLDSLRAQGFAVQTPGED